MKKVLEISLGVLTSVGGFLDVGAIATAVEAGAVYGFQLIWAVVLGTVCIIFLVEMSGRLAAVSRHTLADALRERFGFNYFVFPLCAEVLTNFLLLGAEVGGVCLALQLVTGVSFRWWAVPVAFVLWLLLWLGTFGLLEKGISVLGLVTLCFVVGAVKLQPSFAALGANVVPSLPRYDRVHYWFTAVAMLSALISSYLFYFYSSGAVEDKWDESHLGVNRAVATIGMSFGSLISLGVLVVSALALQPRGIRLDRYEQAALMLTPVFGYWGFILFAASLGITCFGAALEVSLDLSYMVAQGFGWNWGENQKPAAEARFSFTYTLVIFLSALLMVVGIDPLKLTLFTMATTALILPLDVAPFLILMNDQRYVGEHRNGWVSNTMIILIIGLTFLIAAVAIPLEIFGG
jgi:Mn2+/Fe2+ NRAMP family transporter